MNYRLSNKKNTNNLLLRVYLLILLTRTKAYISTKNKKK